MIQGGQGLTEVSTERLRALFKYLYKGQVECPLTPAALAMAGLQDDTETLLSVLRGLDDRAVRAVLVAVLAERS